MVTVLTRTIGPSGRDYASFTLAEADVTNIGTSADLVANDEAIVFEADAGIYTEAPYFNSTLTTDATRNVTYRPASGAEHGGVFGAGVVLHDNGSGYGAAVTVADSYTVFDGLEVHVSNTSGFRTGMTLALLHDLFGVKIRNMLMWSQTNRTPLGSPTSGSYDVGSSTDPIVYENVLFRKTDNFADLCGAACPSGQIGHFVIANCTFISDLALNYRAFAISAQGTLNVQVTNCMSHVPWQWYQTTPGTLNLTGSNNFGGSSLPFPVAIQGSPYPITPTTSFSTPLGSGDYAVYMGATGALADVTGNDVWQQGVGPASNSDVPTTDINGVTRSGTSCNPGAFEADGFVAPTVITKTIAASGADYATFALAEADTSNIGTSADLVLNNEAIVFEADDTTFAFGASALGIGNTALTTDATRNVSYTAASGTPLVTYSGTSRAISIYDSYTRWSGISVETTTSRGVMLFANSGYGANVGATIENCTITAPSQTAIQCDKNATAVAMGTSAEPIVLQNVVTKSRTALGQYIAGTGHTTGAHARVVNCTHLSNSTSTGNVWSWSLAGGMPDASFKIINCANLASDASNDANITGGGVDVSGSTNNIGNAAAPTSSFRFENIGGGIGTQYTPSTAYDPGAGDFALYVGKNGALLDSPNNDVVGQGVGPSANASVPVTDILGNARSGATANPGAFEQPQATATITKTIGPSGRDYTTFTLAEADVTNIGGSADLVNENERIVFEADAATYNESVTFSSTLTTDATRQVTYKPASGAGHGGVAGSGVHIEGSIAATTTDDYLSLKGLSLKSTVSSGLSQTKGIGLTVADCVVETSASGNAAVYSRSASGHASLEMVNSVTIPTTGPAMWLRKTASLSYSASVYNCTTKDQIIKVQSDGGVAGIDITNCLSLGSDSYLNTSSGGGSITLSGSNNFGGSTNPFPAAIQGSPYPITPSTAYDPGAGDFALYVGKNGALLDSPNNDVIDQGVGPSANSDVPTTDILGNARSGATANPGAFEQPQATATLTRTIGPSGRDYTTFTLAEADVTNIGGSADLVNENEAIVFEADAATYNESVTFSSTLTTDATRNVTYKPASGAEHGGVFDSGVILNGTTSTPATRVADDFMCLDGLQINDNSDNGSVFPVWSGASCALKNSLGVVGESDTSWGIIWSQESGSSPVVVENCVFKIVDGYYALGIRIYSYVADTKMVVTNSTFIGAAASGAAIFTQNGSSGTTATLEATNCLNLTSGGSYLLFGTAVGTVTVTGSNNFGGSSDPWPASLQGSPYPITPTTDTDPGAGDWAIYETATGTLVFDSDNDVLLGGIGPASNSDVPTTDIVGTTRSGRTTDPGAFQVSPAGIGAFGIETDEAFGSPTLDATITVTAGRGIVSAEAFGTALIAGADLVVTGIASAEAFGRLVVEAGTQFRLDFQPDSTVVDVMTHVDAPLTTLTGQDRPIPGMVHTINYYAQHLGWSSDQTAASDEPSPYGGDKITVIVPPPRGDGATP